MNTMNDRNRVRSDIDRQLAAQNAQPAWLTCDAHGLRHRWNANPAVSIHVDGYVFRSCTRCPVSVRTKEAS